MRPHPKTVRGEKKVRGKHESLYLPTYTIDQPCSRHSATHAHTKRTRKGTTNGNTTYELLIFGRIASNTSQHKTDDQLN